MKITLWQQFSSNHSSGFTVVGEFATHAEAERAAETIRAILQKIADWFSQDWDVIRAQWDEGEWWETPSPPEQEIAAQYQVEWPGAIDWFHHTKIEIVEDRYVFLTPTQRPEKAGEPFDQLMERLGGKGYHDGNVYGDREAILVYNLTCNAPDEATAQAFYDANLAFDQLVRRDGVHLRLDRWKMDESPLTDVLDELHKIGCTQIEFSFRQFPLDGEHDLVGDEDGDVDWLLDVLQHAKQAEDRGEAARMLGYIGGERAVDPLITALADPNVRSAAASALGLLGDSRVIEHLIPLLSDSDTRVRYAVAGALGQFQDARVVEPLVQMLRDDHTWQQVVPRLGKLGTLAREPLYGALKAADTESLRDRIERALQLIEDTISGGSLLDGMRSSDTSKRADAWAQVKVNADIDTMLMYLKNPVNYSLYTQVIAALAQHPEPHIVEALAMLIRASSAYWTDALRALGQLGAPATEALIELAGDSQVQSYFLPNIIQALGNTTDSRAVDVLIATLDTPDNIQRRLSALALGEIGDARAAQPLAQAYIRSFERWHPEIISAIFQAIQQVKGQPVLADTLIAYLPRAGDALGYAIAALGDIGDPRAIEPLHKLQLDAPENFQQIIEQALRKLQG